MLLYRALIAWVSCSLFYVVYLFYHDYDDEDEDEDDDDDDAHGDNGAENEKDIGLFTITST